MAGNLGFNAAGEGTQPSFRQIRDVTFTASRNGLPYSVPALFPEEAEALPLREKLKLANRSQ